MDIHYLGDHREVIPVLATWMYNEWSYLYPDMTLHYTVSLLQERTNKEKLPLTLLAVEAGEPVGMVSLTTFDRETRTDAPHWLTSLYVVKPWRGRLIGSCLVKNAEEKAAELGICKLFLFTTDIMLPEQFYSKLGWIMKEKTLYHSHHVITMEKDLCPKQGQDQCVR